jgi:hypothetical protein
MPIARFSGLQKHSRAMLANRVRKVVSGAFLVQLATGGDVSLQFQ